MTQQLRTLVEAVLATPWEVNASNTTYLRNRAALEDACKADVIIGLLDQIDALTARFDEAGRYAVMQAGQIDALKAERDKLRYAAQAGRQAMIDHGCAYLGHLKQYTDATNELIKVLGVR